MGGDQDYDSFLGILNNNYVPYYNRDPKRDHHFDNHPYRCSRWYAYTNMQRDIRGLG